MSQLSLLGSESSQQPRPLSLTKLSVELGRSAAAIGLIVVEGEVHGKVNVYDNGRRYFTLKDRTAQISVYVPATRSRHCRTVSGERVAVTGTVQWLGERGQIQFEAKEIVPVGEGAVTLMVAEVRERLRADGLLDRVRKPLPLLPKAIGVVCGNDAAVKKDIEAVVAERFPGYPLRFCEVTVSGSGAAESILFGLRELCRDADVEVVVLARGGGDAAQLLPFSDETLCRAIAECPVPVVSAIGHEADAPLSDEVADYRAGTPSIAAGKVVPRATDLRARIDGVRWAVEQRAEQTLERAGHRVAMVRWSEALTGRVERASSQLARLTWQAAPQRAVDRGRARLGAIAWSAALDRRFVNGETRLQAIVWDRQIDVRTAAATARLDAAHGRVEALSPARVLERGYAVVRDAHGRVVLDVSAIAVGERIEVTLARGSIGAEVREAASS